MNFVIRSISKMSVLGLLLCSFFIQVCLGIDIANISPGSAIIKTRKPFGLGRRLFNVNSLADENTLFIVNGQLAKAGQFPYQAALDVYKGENHHFCGATLLTPSYVITAAHCVATADGLTVLLGALDLTNTDVPAGQVSVSVKAAGITVHPDYSASTYHNDIAIISLGQAVVLSKTIGVVKLPSSPSYQSGATQTLTATGWGKTSDASDPIIPELSYIQVPYLNGTSCKDWYWKNAEYEIKTSQMCTDTVNGQSTCRGDSGGPVVIQNADGTFTLVGIISLGLESCELDGAPNVHTDIYSFLSFIKANTDYKD